MNNKRLGTEFEREVVRLLSKQGYWVHFITPNESGSQPFDVIASKDNEPIVLDCKTSATKNFSISRLEENQRLAFDLWYERGNKKAFVYIKYSEKIYAIPYLMLKGLGKIDLERNECFVVSKNEKVQDV
jgi:Holliday junction resolvase